MSQDSNEDSGRPIVITGFGPIDGPNTIPANLSEEIVRKLYCDLPVGKFIYNSEEITILTGPDPMQTEPIPCCYDDIGPFDDWLKSTCTDARVYVHLGTLLDDRKTISFEKVAYNFPVDSKNCHPIHWDVDYDGHYNHDKECIPDGERYLVSSFNISVLIEKVREATRGRVDPTVVTFRESYNAGSFLCNFLYYKSLFHAKERDNANVIFIHVPEILPRGVELDDMVFIIEQVLCCLLDMQAEGGIDDEDVSQFICPKTPFCSDGYLNRRRHTSRRRLQNTIGGRRMNIARKWQYRKLSRKQARSAHRRRKRKWKSRQRKHIK